MRIPEFFQSCHEDVAALCQRHGVRRLEAFGSVVRSDFQANISDVDLVVDFEPTGTGQQLQQYFGFKAALESLLERPVDLVELQSLPDSRLKRLIMRSKVPVYDAAA